MDAALRSEIELVHLIYVKFRNAQRTQTWWKYFSIFHRRLMQMYARNRIDPTIATFLVRRLIPTAYRQYNSMLAQAAYLNLPIALIAVTAKVYDLLAPSAKPLNKTPKVPQTVADAEEDLGEAIEIEDLEMEVPKPKPKKHKRSKPDKPKKKKRDAIDEIFG